MDMTPWQRRRIARRWRRQRVAQDRECRLLRAVVGWYADPANWTPQVQRPADGAAYMGSNVEAEGYYRLAADTLSVISARNSLIPAYRGTPTEA